MYTCFGPEAVDVSLPFPRTARLAASYGFEGVQVDFEYLQEVGCDSYMETLTEYGLKNGSFQLPVAVDGPEPQYRRDVEQLPSVAAKARRIGCDRCTFVVPSYSDERPYAENVRYYERRLTEPAEILADHGIDLGLEFLGPEEIRSGHEYEFVSDLNGMLELCREIPTSNVGVLLDCWHWYTSGGAVESLERLNPGDVVDVHINDAPSGVPVEDQQDTVRRLPGETDVIDIESFLRNLERIEYDGPVMVEPFDQRLETLDAETTAAKTIESIEQVFERAGR